MDTGLVITGFGPFGGVVDNPTQQLVAHVVKHAAQASHAPDHLLPPQASVHIAAPAPDSALAPVATLPYTLLLHEVLPVAAEDVDSWLDSQLRPCLLANATQTSQYRTPPGLQPSTSEPARDVPGVASRTLPAPSSAAHRSLLVLHLGVATSAKTFRLESCCYNDAAFRIPDQRGWQPCSPHCIDAAAPHGHCLRVPQLDLEAAAKQLQELGHYEVDISTDPGRFVCNWISYRSHQLVSQLGAQLNGNVHVLFVHVPPFEVVSEDTQRAFVLALLQVLHRQLAVPLSGVQAVSNRHDEPTVSPDQMRPDGTAPHIP